LIAAFIALIAYQGSLPGSRDNSRIELLERLGSQVDADARNVRQMRNNTIVLGTLDEHSIASAGWSMSTYEFTHLLPNTRSCAMTVYVGKPKLSGADASASARIELNGTPVALIRFGTIVPDFPIVLGRLAPAGVKPVRIPMTPLFSPSALAFPVSSSFCQADRWRIQVDVRGAIWAIDRVGIVARFSPSHAALAAENVGVVCLAIAVAAVLLLGTHLLFNAVFTSYGPTMLLSTLGIFVCALVTHDEWDFPVWLRFVDLVAFGHASPANMWGGSPLWPLCVGLLGPILSTVYAATGDGSQQIAALFLKLAMALAACGNAFFLCRGASRALRRFLFPILLLSPYVLYELAGGYREIFAGSFFLLGASLAWQGRFTYAALALAAAASISETLVPLVFLPAALRLATGPIGRRSIAFATLDVLAGIAPLAFQWLVLIPQAVVTTALSTRVTAAYRFGGGSWFSTLDGFGLLPAWVGTRSTSVMLGIFILLGAPLVIRIVRTIFTSEASSTLRRQRIFGGFLGLVAVIFLGYRGIDPSTWYALWVVAAFYFSRFEPANPLPFVLSVVQAVAFYAILGIGDFANSTYVMPDNESLLGVLGKPMLVSVLAVNLTVLTLYISQAAGDAVPLFGRGSTWFFLVFLGAAGAAAVKMYPVDIVFCSCVAILLVIAFKRFMELDERRVRRRSNVLDYVGIASLIVVGAGAGTQNQAASLVAFIAMLLGFSYGFGMCDLVLALSGTLLLGTQYGYGWVSIAGYIVLSLVAVTVIGKALAFSRLRKA
jgi:hypothetical protein